MSRSCSLCHSANASLFDGSRHRLAFDRHGWAQCSNAMATTPCQNHTTTMLAAGPSSLCTDCHRQFSKDNPECEATAEYFHQTITQMSEARNKFTAVAEKLAAKGLDVEPISNQLNELDDSLKKSRSHVHSFSRNSFQQVATPGEEAVQRADKLANKAREEYKFRQVGLAASIAVIGLLMVTLYLKLRQLEKRDE